MEINGVYSNFGRSMIRATHEADTDELVRIAEGTGVFKPLEIECLLELLADFGLDAVACAGHRTITYELDGRVVGFAYYAPTPMTVGTWHLYWIFVSKEIQARGLGTEMLLHVESQIADAGGRLLLIETSGLPSYIPTRKFYLKHGYEETGTIRDFYSDGDDQVIFRKRLQ